MEQWRRQELDGEDPGDVALRLFKLQAEVDEAASARAQKASVMLEMEGRLEKARNEFNQLSWEEGNLRREMNELKEYLKGRVA
jgi:predicted  nucleic acid-binding Zn-ribbon protein